MKKEKTNDKADVTANSDQLKILKQHFPSCFDKKGAFIPHKMAEIVGKSELELSKESYSLNWLGKSYARLLANEPPLTLLKESKEHNTANKNSNNLLIKGDNLEVLKHLRHAYREKVKMIYIDPPYNTGGDGFVYNDDRNFKVDELAELAGVDKDDAQRILDFTASHSNSHSAWLTFIYPRLYIARELLRDDGVIFISIDDNEQAQLKMLCDEVFGEDNFIDIFSIRSNPRGNQAKKFTASQHEYILCICKNKNNFNSIGFYKDEIEFSKIDAIGRYREIGLRKRGAGALRRDAPNQWYPIYYNVSRKSLSLDLESKDDIEIFPSLSNGEDGRWRWGKNKVANNKELLFIRKVKRKNGGYEYDVFEKDYFHADKKKKANSIIDDKWANYENATEYLNLLFGASKVFEYAKPVELIQHFILGIGKEDSLILDFFAGSGTTADAVMQLNAEDGGNRQYITVQLAEPIDKKKNQVAYDFVTNELQTDATIFAITKERILRAAEKIKKDNPSYEGDLGFKEYEIVPMFKDQFAEMEELAAEIDELTTDKSDSLIINRLNDEELLTLLTTWMVSDGIALTTAVETLEFNGYPAYYVGRNLYFMYSGFTTEALKAFIKKLDGVKGDDKRFNPNKVVLFGYNFESKYHREIAEALKNYTNRKSIELDARIRY